MRDIGEKINLHSKELAFYRLYLQKEMKSRNLSRNFLIENPDLVPKPEYMHGIVNFVLRRKKVLDIREINMGLKDAFDEMSRYGKQLEPG